MSPLKSAKPTQTMLTYILEQSSGVQKINIPATWKVKVDQGYNNTAIAVITDEKGNVRLSFMHVLSLRDTATKMQEALIDRNNNDEVTWEDVETDRALYRNARESAAAEFQRRNRPERTRRGRNEAPIRDEIPFFEDEIY